MPGPATAARLRARPVLRDAAILCGSIAALLVAALAVQAYRLREPPLPDPIQATPQEQADITRAVLAAGEYATMPLPPPSPPGGGEDPYRDRRDDVPHVMLLASTIALCDPGLAAEAQRVGCAHHLLFEAHYRGLGLDAAIPKLLRQQLTAASAEPIALPDPGYPHATMLGNDAFAAAMRTDGWQGFYRQFPRSSGTFEITWAVLDEAREHALVYAASHCDGTCGTGHYVLLKRSAKGWSISQRFRLWIS